MSSVRMALTAMAAAVMLAGSVEAQQAGGERQRHEGGHRMGPGGFRGLQLSEGERNAMQSVRSRYQPLMQGAREAMRPHMEAQRDARQRGDTVAFRQALARSAEARTRVATLQAQMAAEMRAALTVENRARLDSMRTRMQERRQQGPGRGMRAPAGGHRGAMKPRG
jgi:Spy/CpxP family protein refolding chaperone